MDSQPVMGHYQCNTKTVKDTKVKCATFKSAILKTEKQSWKIVIALAHLQCQQIRTIVYLELAHQIIY